jgi:hemerythrin
MKFYSPKTREKYKTTIINYIRSNSNATSGQIKNETKIKVEKVFEFGLKEAYELSGVPLRGRLLERDRDEQIKDVLEFIKSNPECTVTHIQDITRVTIPRVFGSIKKAYEMAGVNYKRDSQIIKNKIREYVKKYPYSSTKEINEELGVDVHKHFRNFKELCQKAEVPYYNGHTKRLKKVQNKVIEYIQSNPKTTQWEINKKCHTHVQEIFKRGIKEAFSKANVKYPEDRNYFGAAHKHIRNRATKFEKKVLDLFRIRGKVIEQYNNLGGRADGLVNLEGQFFIIEVKDYITKPISMSDVKQLLKYIEATNRCQDGIIVTREDKIPKKNKFYIGGNRISIISDQEIIGQYKGL